MGKHTLIFKNQPRILSTYTVAGPKESSGPLANTFDYKLKDDKFEESTFEKAECKMLSRAIQKSIEKGGLKFSDIDAIISGDLLNQIISASYSARDFDIPFIGVYNACSTMSESLAIGSTLIDGGYMNNVVCATGSHFSTAERQYRYPLELGCTRPPQAQWTVTGAGGVVLTGMKIELPKITMATFGKVMDYGVTDANNMGAAMAPAAMSTLISHFSDTGTRSSDYDLIVTGDLGALGSRILKHLMSEKGYPIENHVDCGELIYNIDEDVFQGGSGAGCSAIVVNGYIYKKLLKGELNKVLFVATGALLSTLSIQQGESIPAVAHAVVMER